MERILGVCAYWKFPSCEVTEDGLKSLRSHMVRGMEVNRGCIERVRSLQQCGVELVDTAFLSTEDPESLEVCINFFPSLSTTESPSPDSVWTWKLLK